MGASILRRGLLPLVPSRVLWVQKKRDSVLAGPGELVHVRCREGPVL